jgi:two-component system cell cycle response regulator
VKNEYKTKEQLINELADLQQRIVEIEKLEKQCRFAEEALRKAEARYRCIFENAVVGIFQTSPEGRYLAANPAFARIMGYDSSDDLVSDAIDFWRSSVDPDRRDALISLTSTEGAVKGLEVQIRRKDGNTLWTSVNITALRDKDDKILGYEGTVVDISEYKRAHEKLQEAETRYHALFCQSPDGVLIIDPQTGVATEFNEAAHMRLGYAREEFKRLSIFDYEAKEKFQDTKKHIEKVLREGREDFETKHRTRDGKIIDVKITVQVINLSGRVFLHCIFRDISEQRRAGEALQKERDRAQEYLDIAGVMIVVVDAAQKVTLVNKKCCEILGYEEQEIVGKNWFDTFLPERVRAQVRDVFAKLISGGARPVEFFENPVVTRNGKERIIAWHNAVLRDTNASIRGTLSSGEDITERKHAEELLQNYMVKLEKSNHIKDLFTDIIRHDLLNPLGVIKTATEQIMLMETRNEKTHNTLLMIKRNADKLIDMIESASMYAALEDRESVEWSKLDLKEIFIEIVDNFKHQLEEKDMTLEFISKEECHVMGSPMIDAVFSNLLSNAIKYSPAGNRIEVGIIDMGKYCRIDVMDWGYGIKDEDKTKLFTRFQRLDKKGVKGTGLGLAIVERVVKLHKGRVWVEDNPEGGSIFCVEIPKD